MTPEFLQSAAPYASALALIIGGLITARTARKNREAQTENEAYASEVASTETAAKEWRALYQEQREALINLTEEVEKLKKRMNDSESREYRMKRDLETVYRWIADGAVPPPPDRPDYIEI